MSTNIQGLIDRTYREYLEPMDDLQPYTLLTSGLTDSADTVSFNGDLLTQEEEDIMEAGSIIEILKSDFKLLILEATAIPAQPPPTIRTFECSIIIKH